MANKISIDDLSKAIGKSVEVYSQKTSKKIRKATKKATRKFTALTRERAPRSKKEKKKHFADSITSTVEESVSGGSKGIWYVKDPDYRLTHLLEHGHQLRNGGRVEGTHFVQKSLDEITDDYLKDLEEAVKDD